MSTPSPSETTPGTPVMPATPPPLTPRQEKARDPSVGTDADPEQDIAPNLGGEEQMQDA